MIPLPRRVLITPDPIATKRGSIHLPDTAQRWPTTGTIAAVGKDCVLKVGDRVTYGAYAVREVPGYGVLAWEKDVTGLIE